MSEPQSISIATHIGSTAATDKLHIALRLYDRWNSRGSLRSNLWLSTSTCSALTSIVVFSIDMSTTDMTIFAGRPGASLSEHRMRAVLLYVSRQLTGQRAEVRQRIIGSVCHYIVQTGDRHRVDFAELRAVD